MLGSLCSGVKLYYRERDVTTGVKMKRLEIGVCDLFVEQVKLVRYGWMLATLT